SPRDLRRRNDEPFNTETGLTVRLPYRKPFDWRGLMQFFTDRATPGVEQVLDDVYLRSIAVNKQSGVVECRHLKTDNSISLTLHGVATAEIFQVVQRARELLDLDAPVAEIGATLGADKDLGRMIKQRPGVRVPGAWDGFELTVRAILGQQVSVKAATTLAGRIAARYGAAIELPASFGGRGDSLTIERLFPGPEKLMRARFNNIGLVTTRAETIRRVAAAVVRGELSFDNSQDIDEFCRSLTAIRGIGDWTAQYVAMRAMKSPDAFPASDLGLLKAIAKGENTKPVELLRRAESWRPWRAYAALLLWGSLSGSGG
ncbi:MAG: DNA-3-methyladenine glycosylase, partial [Gammaproteobacteria bacterium]|nr:DNA-3-methyladenine glycosylase [Gammaproteobacteria bacterium]